MIDLGATLAAISRTRRRSSLRGKVVLITGAASGIGRATALAFARAGAALHLTDLRSEPLERTCSEAGTEGATRAVAHRVDSRDPQAVERLAAAVFEREGRVDVLHNNAGVCCGGPAEQLSLDDWHWQLDTNLWGVIHGVHAFLPRMLSQGGGGWIVNSASMAGLVGLPFVAPYCTSKFAIVGLSEALDAELAPRGVRVVAVCPGAVRTGLFSDAQLKLPSAWADPITQGLKRFGGDPARVASRIVSAVASGDSAALLLPSSSEMLPLYLLKRLSPGIYQRAARLIGTLGR